MARVLIPRCNECMGGSSRLNLRVKCVPNVREFSPSVMVRVDRVSNGGFGIASSERYFIKRSTSDAALHLAVIRNRLRMARGMMMMKMVMEEKGCEGKMKDVSLLRRKLWFISVW